MLLTLFAALIALALGSVFFGLLSASATPTGSLPDIIGALQKTTLQAALSTFWALGVGMAIAAALHRLRFFGRALFIGILSVGIVAPAISIAFGILSLWGRTGLIASSFSFFGLAYPFSPFGLHAVILAHIVLSGALAARVFHTALDLIPAQRLKVASSLGLLGHRRFAILDWPVLRAALPSLSALIFLLSFTSFPIVLLLGGGPKVTTFEVLIYQASRQDFNLHAAAILAITQLLVCTLLILPNLLYAPKLTGSTNVQNFHLPDSLWVNILAAFTLILALPLIILPTLNPLWALINIADLVTVLQQPAVQSALIASLIFATLTASIITPIAFLLTSARSAMPKGAFRTLIWLPAFAYLAVPAVVLSLGAFILINPMPFEPSQVAPIVIVFGAGLLSLPFALGILSPAMDEVMGKHQKLATTLGLKWHQKIKIIQLPLLRNELALVWALAFCFSLGDLGIISMFGTQDFATLPWMIFRAMGAYRNNDAAILTAVLLSLCLIVFLTAPIVARITRPRSRKNA